MENQKKQMTEEEYKAKFEKYSLENLGDTFYVSNEINLPEMGN